MAMYLATIAVALRASDTDSTNLIAYAVGAGPTAVAAAVGALGMIAGNAACYHRFEFIYQRFHRGVADTTDIDDVTHAACANALDWLKRTIGAMSLHTEVDTHESVGRRSRRQRNPSDRGRFRVRMAAARGNDTGAVLFTTDRRPRPTVLPRVRTPGEDRISQLLPGTVSPPNIKGLQTMTTAAVIVFPQKKICVIGTDGQITVGHQRGKLSAKKFFVEKRVGFEHGVGCTIAGSANAGYAAFRLLQEVLRETSNIEEAVIEFHKRSFKDDIIRASASSSPTLCIMGTPEKLYTIPLCDMPMESAPEHFEGLGGIMFATAGSGGDLCQGAIYGQLISAKYRKDLTGKNPADTADVLKEIMVTAIGAGIKFDIYSGGQPEVEVLRGEG